MNNIRKIASIREILPHITPKTLVVFDIDHTLLEGAEIYGHCNWFYDRLKEAADEGLTRKEALNRVYIPWNRSQEDNKVKPVEADIPEIIETLQKQGTPIIGLTARQPLLEAVTFRQLSDLKIDLRVTVPLGEPFEKKFTETCSFERGTLYCSELNHKSEVLISYLEHVGFEPQSVVFVDDVWEHLEDVSKAFSQKDISCQSFHYPLVEERRESYWDIEEARAIFAEKLGL